MGQLEEITNDRFISLYRKKKKNNTGTEALNENNLVCRAIQLIKKNIKMR